MCRICRLFDGYLSYPPSISLNHICRICSGVKTLRIWVPQPFSNIHWCLYSIHVISMDSPKFLGSHYISLPWRSAERTVCMEDSVVILPWTCCLQSHFGHLISIPRASRLHGHDMLPGPPRFSMYAWERCISRCTERNCCQNDRCERVSHAWKRAGWAGRKIHQADRVFLGNLKGGMA